MFMDNRMRSFLMVAMDLSPDNILPAIAKELAMTVQFVPEQNHHVIPRTSNHLGENDQLST